MEKGPQFKVFHGDQGTLFNQQEHQAIQAQRVAGDERYPRGFTPERYRAVRDIFGGREMEHNVYGGNQKPADKDESGFAVPVNEKKERGFLSRREGQAKVVETIARSTAPIEHLATNSPTIWIKNSAEGAKHHAAGTYWSRDVGGKPKIEIYNKKPYEYQHEEDPDDPLPPPSKREVSRKKQHNRESQELTLMHELGHHASTVEDTVHHGRPFPEAQGAEEAFADDYKDTHWRPDPRDVRASLKSFSPDWKGPRKYFDPRPYHSYDQQHTVPRNPYVKPEDEGYNEAQSKFAGGYEANRKARPEYKTLTERIDEDKQAEVDRPAMFEVDPRTQWSPKEDKRLMVSRQLRDWT